MKNYNLFFCSGGNPARWNWNSVAKTKYGAYLVESGLEARGIYADPRFVSDNPVTAADFRLKPTSPCINAGLDLKAANLLTYAQDYKDYLGVVIPQGAGADIGPYERPSIVPLSPTNLQVISN